MAETVAIKASSGKLQRVLIACVPLMMLAYPAFVAAGTGKGEAGWILLGGLIAYPLAVYLFWGIGVLAFRGQMILLMLGGIGGAAVGVGISGPEESIFVLANWGMILLTGVLAGRFLATGRRTLDAYVAGVLVVIVLAVVAWMPTWQTIYQEADQTVSATVTQVTSGLKDLGYNDQEIADRVGVLKELLALSLRIAPASIVMSVILQFTLGFLWLLSYVVRRNPLAGQLKPFVLWKMPFALAPILAIAILARLLGNEIVTLAGDNLLLILAIFYSVSGLAMTEWVMHRFGVKTFARVLFYVVLFLTGVVGMVSMVLIGFIDSFKDWRKVTARLGMEN